MSFHLPDVGQRISVPVKLKGGCNWGQTAVPTLGRSAHLALVCLACGTGRWMSASWFSATIECSGFPDRSLGKQQKFLENCDFPIRNLS